MENIYLISGIASLQLLLIFTLTYLQHEIGMVSKLWKTLSKKLLSMPAMLLSVGWIYLGTLTTEQSIRILLSILLIITLSITINYTYTDYTLEEGFHITIPYLIIYSCILFFFSTTGYFFLPLQSSIILLCSLICYSLFWLISYLDKGFRTSYLNYFAFLGLVLSSGHVVLLLNYPKKLTSDFLTFHLIQIYLYLAHLLSVKFEMNAETI